MIDSLIHDSDSDAALCLAMLRESSFTEKREEVIAAVPDVKDSLCLEDAKEKLRRDAEEGWAMTKHTHSLTTDN